MCWRIPFFISRHMEMNVKNLGPGLVLLELSRIATAAAVGGKDERRQDMTP